jgi:Uma2 family endonuclease
MNALSITLDPIIQLTDAQFYQLCQLNPDLKFERSAVGELLIMPPTGGETGKRNATLISRFIVWNEQSQLGEVFDSSTCFKLPNGADRSPDVSWVRRDRWDALTLQEKEKFPPIAPDFVLELMSPSDNLKAAQTKMQEYMDNGVKLGWLINRQNRTIEVYRPDRPVEILQSPATLSGEDVLLGFRIDLKFVW